MITSGLKHYIGYMIDLIAEAYEIILMSCHLVSLDTWPSRGQGDPLEIVFCRSSLIQHQAIMDSKSGMLFSDSLYYYFFVF